MPSGCTDCAAPAAAMHPHACGPPGAVYCFLSLRCACAALHRAPAAVHGRRRTWVAKNFVKGLALCDKIGAVAEQEGHHPDLHLTGLSLAR